MGRRRRKRVLIGGRQAIALGDCRKLGDIGLTNRYLAIIGDLFTEHVETVRARLRLGDRWLR